jgi:hypothetical protein
MRTILKDISEAAFHTLCKVLLCCISWPFSRLARSSKKRQREIDAGYRLESLPGRSIVKKRRRALTLPLPLPIGSEKDGHASPPSGLLTKLPIELRQQIWRECMGGVNFHIGFGWVQHLHSIVCCSPNTERCDDMYGHTGCRKYSAPRSMRNRPEMCVVSLLLTCRQM